MYDTSSKLVLCAEVFRMAEKEWRFFPIERAERKVKSSACDGMKGASGSRSRDEVKRAGGGRDGRGEREKNRGSESWRVAEF